MPLILTIVLLAACTPGSAPRFWETPQAAVNADHPALAAWPEWGAFPFEAAGHRVPAIAHPDALGLPLQDTASQRWHLVVGQPGDGTWGVDDFDPPRPGDLVAADAVMGPGEVGLLVAQTSAGELWLYEWAPGFDATGELIPIDGPLGPPPPTSPGAAIAAGQLFVDALDDRVLVTFAGQAPDGRLQTRMALRQAGSWTVETVFEALEGGTEHGIWATLGALLPDGRPVVGTVHGQAAPSGALYRARLDGVWVDVAATGDGRHDIARDADGRVFISPSLPRGEPEYDHEYHVLFGKGYRRRDINWERTIRDPQTRSVAVRVELGNGRVEETGGGVWTESGCGTGFDGPDNPNVCTFEKSPYWVGDNVVFAGQVHTHGSYRAHGDGGPVARDLGGVISYVPPDELPGVVTIEPPSGSTLAPQLEWIRVTTDKPGNAYLSCRTVERLARRENRIQDLGSFELADGLVQYDPDLCDDYASGPSANECLRTTHDFVCLDRDCAAPGYDLHCEVTLATWPHGAAGFAEFGLMRPPTQVVYHIEGAEPPPRPGVAALHSPDHECHHNAAAGSSWYGSFDAGADALAVGVTDAQVWLEDASGNEVPSTVSLIAVSPVIDEDLFEPATGTLYRGFDITWSDDLVVGADYTVRVTAENAMLGHAVHEGAGLTFTADVGNLTVESTPAAGAVDVALDQAVVVSFGLAIPPLYVDPNYMGLRAGGLAVPAIHTQLDAQTVRILPVEPLAPSTEYELWIDGGLTSTECGRPLAVDDRSRVFTTEAP